MADELYGEAASAFRARLRQNMEPTSGVERGAREAEAPGRVANPRLHSRRSALVGFFIKAGICACIMLALACLVAFVATPCGCQGEWL